MPVIDIMDESAGPILALRVSGGRGRGAAPSDVATRADEIARRHGSFRLLVVVEDLGLFEAASLRSQLPLAAGLAGRVDRVAVVGDQAWLKAALRSAPAGSGTEIRHYPAARAEDAWEWLRSSHTSI